MHFKNGISDCVLSTGSVLFAFLGKFATMANNIAEDEQVQLKEKNRLSWFAVKR